MESIRYWAYYMNLQPPLGSWKIWSPEQVIIVWQLLSSSTLFLKSRPSEISCPCLIKYHPTSSPTTRYALVVAHLLEICCSCLWKSRNCQEKLRVLCPLKPQPFRFYFLVSLVLLSYHILFLVNGGKSVNMNVPLGSLTFWIIECYWAHSGTYIYQWWHYNLLMAIPGPWVALAVRIQKLDLLGSHQIEPVFSTNFWTIWPRKLHWKKPG